MPTPYSLWALKKLPMEQIIEYIQQNSGKAFQARMASVAPAEYEQLSTEQAKQRLSMSISTMDEEAYDDFLLEIIDE